MSNDKNDGQSKRSWVDKRVACTPNGVFAQLKEVIASDVERIHETVRQGTPGSKRIRRGPFDVDRQDTLMLVRAGIENQPSTVEVQVECTDDGISVARRQGNTDIASFAVTVKWCPKSRRCYMAYDDCDKPPKNVRHISQRALEPLFFV